MSPRVHRSGPRRTVRGLPRPYTILHTPVSAGGWEDAEHATRSGRSDVYDANDAGDVCREGYPYAACAVNAVKTACDVNREIPPGPRRQTVP